uniref:Uncharacterized protein n=1 Tax=Chromera velia CCMP2878 TaxID=1169474 RepID=A0A0G4I5C6_9ALVE|eukprot:Cvel_11115.t1-p1 / transcript=Cvel_11115.t1 / gene=Cvel_11115 / organism=Chromera_velia_CCMP2878 / gene_product=hypothetical protein / transcript_product=hypothetical protein / location=Cvel_scaffold688:23607-24131(-) / protein_length=175 / sequence_SO=supercontig / SO=protein_coding / is_pseudo=false
MKIFVLLRLFCLLALCALSQQDVARASLAFEKPIESRHFFDSLRSEGRWGRGSSATQDFRKETEIKTEVSFEDGTSFDLTRYQATDDIRQQFNTSCDTFSGWKSGWSSGRERCANFVFQVGRLYEGGPVADLAAVRMNLYGYAMNDANKVIRQEAGERLPLELKVPILLTASGLN